MGASSAAEYLGGTAAGLASHLGRLRDAERMFASLPRSAAAEATAPRQIHRMNLRIANGDLEGALAAVTAGLEAQARRGRQSSGLLSAHAEVLYELGNLESAAEVAQDARQILRGHDGAEYPSMATLLARIEAERGNLERAAALADRAMAHAHTAVGRQVCAVTCALVACLCGDPVAAGHAGDRLDPGALGDTPIAEIAAARLAIAAVQGRDRRGPLVALRQLDPSENTLIRELCDLCAHEEATHLDAYCHRAPGRRGLTVLVARVLRSCVA